jgi:uncharacterized membrane protein
MVNKIWPSDWQVRLIQLLAIPGLLVSFYLFLYHHGDLVNVCRPSGWDDCGKVSGPGAPYSSIGPIPIALIGLVGYALIFLVSWLKEWWSLLDDYFPEIMTALTGFAFLFSLALAGLELFVIKAICRFCVLSALIITIMLVLSITYLRAVNRAAMISDVQES